MDVSTKLELSKALRSEAALVLATMSLADRSVLMEQRPGAPQRPILDEEADRLVQLGLAVRTSYGVDLTMLGRVAARVAYEVRLGAGLGVRRTAAARD